eukprot:m.824104 g.824104  ORF g.824104 m.824104 type:complete len:81 (-) comp59404_c0_seq2:8-250(-)
MHGGAASPPCPHQGSAARGVVVLWCVVVCAVCFGQIRKGNPPTCTWPTKSICDWESISPITARFPSDWDRFRHEGCEATQ